MTQPTDIAAIREAWNAANDWDLSFKEAARALTQVKDWAVSPALPTMLDEVEALRAERDRLRDIVCLADELLMKAIGAFPLPGNPLREHALVIREVSGNNHHVRKERAARAALNPEKPNG